MTAFARIAFPVASAIALLATPLAAQDDSASPPSPMQAQDLVTMPRLGSPAVSQDGSMAVYSVTTTDGQSYARSGQLYLQSLDGDGMATPVALDLKGSSASFGPGKTLFYLAPANGAGATQV